MKRIILILCSVLITLSTSLLVHADGLRILPPGGMALEFDSTSPYVDQNNRTMFPLKCLDKIFKQGISYVIDGDKITINKEIFDNKTVITLYINSKTLYKNNEIVEMDTTPVNREGTIYVPLKFVGDALEYSIWWDERYDEIYFSNHIAEVYIWNEDNNSSPNGLCYSILPGTIKQKGLNEIQKNSTKDFNDIKKKLSTLCPGENVLTTALYRINGYKVPYENFSEITDNIIFSELGLRSSYNDLCLDEIPPIIKDFDEFENEWFSMQLFALGENCIYDGNKEVYRFTYIPSFNEPISIRVEINENGKGTLYFAQCNGTISYSSGDLIKQKQINLGTDEVNRLLSAINEKDFWNLTKTEEVLGCDGSEWIVEGVKGINYHAVKRWSPNEGAIYDIGKFFIELSKEKIEYLY